jgi:hypothetical protein
MSNSSPSPATRFGALRGNPPARASAKWLREMVDMVDPENGKTKRQMIAEHLLELATSYSVIHMGRKLELASGRDSVEAAKILFAYCYGKPQESTEDRALQLAEHLRSVARDQVDIGRTLLGKKLEAMTEKEIAEFWRLCDFGVARYLQAAMERVACEGGTMPADAPQISESPSPSKQVLGTPCPTVAAEGETGVEASASPPADRTEVKPSAENVTDEAGTTSYVEPVGCSDEPSPKDRDMADHGPSITERPTRPAYEQPQPQDAPTEESNDVNS